MNKLLLIVIVLVTLVSIKKYTTDQTSQVRIITYNVWKGFEDAPKRYSAFIEWMKEQNTDIVALQELKGYTNEQLQIEAKQWGHSYSILLETKTGYHLGVTSTKPISFIETIQDKMAHGLLHCKTFGIDIFVTHLSPFTYKERQNEVAFIAGEIKNTSNDKIIFLGDFNALSPKDSIRYESTTLFQYFFERDSIYENNSNLNQGNLDYSVIGEIDNMGLIDLMDEFQPTFPTQCKFETNSFSKYSTEATQNISRQIDYIYASPSLVKHSTSAYVIDNEQTNMISDHFPLIAEFNFPKEK
ncbi:MAG: endonuclease/exonuclease/phosphatase family protein [Candidatus Marinimicrobia bacterium]|nr:endonuclease/exonuclease/phosphatase family protein [Candidatus Neomarinimicrobiota bacterium]